MNELQLKEQVVREFLNGFFKTHYTISTSNLLTKLKQNFPQYSWERMWVSKFLTKNYSSKMYNFEPTSKKQFFAELPELQHFKEGSFSKKDVQRVLKQKIGKINNEKINEILNRMVWNGKYNRENHKLYILPNDFASIDFTKVDKIELEMMISSYPEQITPSLILDSESKLYKILECYFTHEIRIQLKTVLQSVNV